MAVWENCREKECDLSDRTTSRRVRLQRGIWLDRRNFLGNNIPMELMNMFEIENCYRIIFEAMLEESALRCIAERIEQYADAGIAFVTGTGEILACSRLWVELFPVSAGKGYLTFEDYTTIYGTEEDDGRCCGVIPVYEGKMIIGYVVLVYKEKEERSLFQELGLVLAENVKRYFEEEQKAYAFRQPLKEHMISRMIFEDGALKLTEETGCLEGKYIVVLFCKKNGKAEEMVSRLYNIWHCIQIYEEKDEIFALLYQVKDQDMETICAGIEAEKQKCCVSDIFPKLSLCRGKKNMLKRMAQVKESQETAVVRREKDWTMMGMYTYTVPLIKQAGLSDYSIEQLILEDEKNHTELYQSLKIYLLCGNNVTTAAKRLHIHRNTLVYRLKQIKEIIDEDMNDYEVSRELLAYIMMRDVAG